MGIKRQVMVLSMCAFLLCGCHERTANSNKDTTLASFATLADEAYSVSSRRMKWQMDSLLGHDRGDLATDAHVRNYYRGGGNWLWVDRLGIDSRADTLVSYLKRVGEEGFSTRRFFVRQIESDLQRVRHLDFGGDGINRVLARLEYRLTKAYLHYATGQRFGYLNPTFTFNRIDSLETNRNDSVKRPVRYRGLFDIAMDHADKNFYHTAMRKAGDIDSLSAFLRDIQPQDAFYRVLKEELRKPHLTKEMRTKIICNMERCRWRLHDHPQDHKKYVMVNIPSFHLAAIDRGDTLNMRIGCGSFETKTPLLTSCIKRMDVNPKWFVPRSIVEKDIVRHVGNRHYFDSRNFYVVDRKSGGEVDFDNVTRELLLTPGYSVVQRGGKGNSLGRIIFRFDNNFSVYLHDTSSRDVFSRTDRGVSHGCVRVEKPFELAAFLLKDKDQRLLDKIEYSMTADSLADRNKVVGSVKVQPEIPVFITYFTLYPVDYSGKSPGMSEYADVYGYDRIIYDFLDKHYR